MAHTNSGRATLDNICTNHSRSVRINALQYEATKSLRAIRRTASNTARVPSFQWVPHSSLIVMDLKATKQYTIIESRCLKNNNDSPWQAKSWHRYER